VGGGSNLIYFPIRKSLSTVALAQDQQVFEPGLVATGDFNRDGKLDLATGNGCIDTNCAGTVDVYLGNGDGTFGRPIRTIVPGDGSPTSGGASACTALWNGSAVELSPNMSTLERPATVEIRDEDPGRGKCP